MACFYLKAAMTILSVSALRILRFRYPLTETKHCTISRVNAAKHPTYDKIMANVALGAAKGCKISLRFNYTPETLDSYADVLTDLESLSDEIRRNISCSFHQVWQTGANRQESPVKEKADKLVDYFRRSGFATGCDRRYDRYVCYGDKANHAVINYNGDMYKCTAREFTPSMREGKLLPDGTMEWNERYNHRMAIKYADKTCHQCNIMPICNGGCAQNKLERSATKECPKGRDANAKKEYLLMALKYRLNQ